MMVKQNHCKTLKFTMYTEHRYNVQSERQTGEERESKWLWTCRWLVVELRWAAALRVWQTAADLLTFSPHCSHLPESIKRKHPVSHSCEEEKALLMDLDLVSGEAAQLMPTAVQEIKGEAVRRVSRDFSYIWPIRYLMLFWFAWGTNLNEWNEIQFLNVQIDVRSWCGPNWKLIWKISSRHLESLYEGSFTAVSSEFHPRALIVTPQCIGWSFKRMHWMIGHYHPEHHPLHAHIKANGN